MAEMTDANRWRSCPIDGSNGDELFADAIRHDQRRRPHCLSQPRRWPPACVRVQHFRRVERLSTSDGRTLEKSRTDWLSSDGGLFATTFVGWDPPTETLRTSVLKDGFEILPRSWEPWALPDSRWLVSTLVPLRRSRIPSQNHATVSRLVLLSPWASGARHLRIPELRAAYSAEAEANRESRRCSQTSSGASRPAFQDADLVRQGTEAFLQSTSPEGSRRVQRGERNRSIITSTSSAG